MCLSKPAAFWQNLITRLVTTVGQYLAGGHFEKETGKRLWRKKPIVLSNMVTLVALCLETCPSHITLRAKGLKSGIMSSEMQSEKACGSVRLQICNSLNKPGSERLEKISQIQKQEYMGRTVCWSQLEPEGQVAWLDCINSVGGLEGEMR